MTGVAGRAVRWITWSGSTTTARAALERSGPAIQIGGQVDDQRLADRIVTIEPIDRATHELALRIVSVECGLRVWYAVSHLGLEPAGELADESGI